MLGVAFEVVVPDVAERADGDPVDVALENARRKGESVAARTAGGGREGPVLACDTVVSLDSRLYGKPAGRDDAEATLRALSGRTHEVVSGLWVDGQTAYERTAVTFAELAEPRLAWYLDTREWEGRAGAYAIQGAGAALVARIDGPYHNVVGLPVQAFLHLLPQALA